MSAVGPRIVQVLEFASARAPELQALLELSQQPALQSPADAKLSAQFARRRRRANAFKSHRLPRRLRQQGEASGGDREKNTEESAPRCRMHARRPHLLAAARSWAAAKERGGDSEARAVWLPTHVWHSKRMKMTERYGVALAAHRADKSVSASLEALRSKATLHDMTYFGILELYGLPQLILEALQLVSDPAGSDFHGIRFLAGAEEGQSVLYYENQFPTGAVCPVSFMWRPLEADKRSMDAATGNTLANLSLLREPAQSELAQAEEILCPVSHEPLTLQGKDAEEPDSALILKKLAEVLSWTSTPSADAGPLAATYPFVSPLEAMESSELVEEALAMHVDEDSASLVPCSFLWSKTKRQVLNDAFQKDHEINDKRYRERKSRSLASSEPTSETAAAVSSMLHMLAIEKRGPFKSTSGWDLILTPTFAPAVLKALVFAGALVVGLDENDSLSTVLEQPSFPRDFPDTLAGESLWQTEAEVQQAAHLRKPKSKRFLHEKHGVESPFQPNWKQLFPVSEARGEEVADTVDIEEDGGDAEGEDALCVLRGEQYMQPFCFFEPRDGGASLSSDPPEKIPVAMRTLVRVVLRVPGRGSLEANTMLFAPSASDVESFYEQKNWRGVQVTDAQAPERLLAGFVTSAVYDRPKGAFRATGFCACEPLQDVFLVQLDQMKSREALVMARAPRGNMYRPALIRAEA